MLNLFDTVKPSRDKVQELRRRNCRYGAAGGKIKSTPIIRIEYVASGVLAVLMLFAALEIVLSGREAILGIIKSMLGAL